MGESLSLTPLALSTLWRDRGLIRVAAIFAVCRVASQSNQSRAWRERDPIPSAVQFWRRIGAAAMKLPDLVRSFHGLADTALPARARENIVGTMLLGLHALLPQKERLIRTFHQALRTPSLRKKPLMFAAAGLMGLALIFSLLEISVRREAAKAASAAAIDALAAESTTSHQIAFAERFAIPLTSPTPLGGVDSGAERTTMPSDDVQTVGRVSRAAVPLPRPRKHR